MWVDDLRAEDVARKIVEVARTGRMGDGKIFILPAQPYEAVIDVAIVMRLPQVNIRLCWLLLASCRKSARPPHRRRQQSRRASRPASARLGSKHFMLYTDVPSSPEVDRLAGGVRPGRAAVGRIFRHRRKQRLRIGRPRRFSSASGAGSTRWA